MDKPTIYLAGPIRNSHIHEDSLWREKAIQLFGTRAHILNPLAKKSYNKKTNEWKLCGGNVGRGIVGLDFWCVDHSDLIIFNMLALAEGYPMIGTLSEWGRSTATTKLRFTILPESYTGHGNLSTFGLHPFLNEPSDMIFNDVRSCFEFTSDYLDVISGRDPHFGGVKE